MRSSLMILPGCQRVRAHLCQPEYRKKPATAQAASCRSNMSNQAWIVATAARNTLQVKDQQTRIRKHPLRRRWAAQ
jgi:hypothetical protein